jgi:hypothetical protein
MSSPLTMGWVSTSFDSSAPGCAIPVYTVWKASVEEWISSTWSGLYPPGTIRRDLLRSTAPPHCPHSLHTISVDAVLSLGSLTGLRLPDEVILYTIEAVDIETFGARCSEGVQASLPDVVSRLMEEIISILPDALCIARPEEISQMVSSSSDKFTNVFE